MTPRAHRVVANVQVASTAGGRQFWEGFLGLSQAFDMGWVVGYRSMSDPAVQVHFVTRDATAPVDSRLSVDVPDVDAAYAEALRRGYPIVHPLTEEPWGVRRFFVRDPYGVVVNVAQHDD